MEILYSTTTAARMLDIKPCRLKRWVDYGYYHPAAKAMLGQINCRLFSEHDLEILRDILGQMNEGVPVGRAFRERRESK